MTRRPLLTLALTLSILLVASSAFGAPGRDAFTRALSQGPAAAALAAFLGGLLVSLTPCVYPMVAVTVSVFGATKTKSRWQGLALSSAFVFGIMVMFVGLGLIAAASGNVFGSALQNTWVVLGISLLFVVMAFSMFGAFELALPSGLLNRLATMGGIGLRGAFVLGLVSGIVASPCTGPILTGILAWIATTHDYFLGTLAMSAFALGLGVPFFAVGAFAVQLPRSGRWMITVKYVLGVVLLVVAFYFAGSKIALLSRLVPYASVGWLVAFGALGLGLIVALVVRRTTAERLKQALLVFAVTASTLGGYGIVTKLTRAEVTLTWQHQHFAQHQQRALSAQRPMLVDFTANWCAACKELERETFAHPDVSNEAGRFLAVKVDASVDDDPEVVATMKTLAVKGLPTVILFDSQGHEAERFTDFVKADVMLGALRQVK